MGKESVVLQYRSFRNTDPPGLVEIWNETFTNRGAVRLRHSAPLERFAFAKPYFDPNGLIVALDGDRRVGFAHAGFGPNAQESALATDSGVLCLIGVRPSHRRRGVGTELLNRCESYLRQRGASALWAGPMRPLDPFYFALYGGCDMPGFLESDRDAAPFLQARGYAPTKTCLVYQRRLDRPVNVVDARFGPLRARFDMQVLPRVGAASWWQECVNGPIEFLEFRLVERGTGRAAARADVWEMEGYALGWGLPTIGIRGLQVADDRRRQGLAKFLVTHILRYMQEQYFSLVEIQAMQDADAANSLCKLLGFEQVDVGHLYRRND